MAWLFSNKAKPEEQGSFCDVASNIHYVNESKEATLNSAAVFEEHEEGAELNQRSDEAEDPKSLPDNTRFNNAVMESDRYGSEHPAYYRPGR